MDTAREQILYQKQSSTNYQCEVVSLFQSGSDPHPSLNLASRPIRGKALSRNRIRQGLYHSDSSKHTRLLIKL